MNVRPESAVRARVGGWGAVGAVVGFVGGWLSGQGTGLQWLLLVVGAAAPMWWLEWRKVPLPVPKRTVGRRVSLLGVGVITMLQIVILTLQLLVGGDKGGAVALVIPALLVAGVVMLLLAMASPERLGATVTSAGGAACALLRLRRLTIDERNALLGWCVKCFFLPLMLAWSWNWLAGLEFRLPQMGPLHWYVLGMTLLYAIDTAFGVIGYVSTARCVGGEIRSVDATPMGWLSALACYPPLSVLVLDAWLGARNSNDWRLWLDDGSTLQVLWAISILLLTSIYTWSTVAFGLRFSNLTHRGIITHGPYRWSKHPAYISKNLSWWLISVPFLVTTSVKAAMLACLAMLTVNAIYWLRARTEERHLMSDPIYRDYADWIAQHGLFARLVGRAQ